MEQTVFTVKPQTIGDGPSFETSFSKDNILMKDAEFSKGMLELFDSYKPAWF